MVSAPFPVLMRVDSPSKRSDWISIGLFFFIASLLAFAAVAKLLLVLFDPFADLVAGWPLGVLWMTLIVESSVIVVLFGRNSYSVKWTVCFVLFLGFLFISVVRFLLGFESCGCFGAMVLPSYASALISCVILGLLMRSAIRTQQSILGILQQGYQAIRDNLAPKASQWIGLVIVLISFTILTFEPVKQRLRKVIDGEGVIAEPVWLDGLVLGQPFQGEITLRNLSIDPVTLVGSKSSCSCMSVNFQRTTLDGRASLKQRFQIVPGSVGRIHQRLIFYLDLKRQYCIAVDIVGYSKERSDETKHENR